MYVCVYRKCRVCRCAKCVVMACSGSMKRKIVVHSQDSDTMNEYHCLVEVLLIEVAAVEFIESRSVWPCSCAPCRWQVAVGRAAAVQ